MRFNQTVIEGADHSRKACAQVLLSLGSMSYLLLDDAARSTPEKVKGTDRLASLTERYKDLERESDHPQTTTGYRQPSYSGNPAQKQV